MNGRCIIVFMLVLAALASRSAVGVRGQGEATSHLDLPAMALTPTDIEAIGLAGFGRIGNGEFRTFDAYVARRAEFLNRPEAEVRSAFEDAGWQRGYVTNLGLPAEAGDPESPSIQIAFSVAYEYTDAEGAATAFAFNRDLDSVTTGSVEVLSPSQPYADESYATRLVTVAPEDGEPSDQVDLTLRRGNVIASTGLLALWRGEDSATPAALPSDALSIVERMAERLLERVDAALAGETPDLSDRVLRLGNDDAPIAFSSEGYRRLNGDDPPYFNGYSDDFPGPDEQFDEVTTAYELNQGVQMPGDPYYVVRLFLFSSAVGADDYVASVRAAGISPAGTPAEEVVGANQLGDGSWTASYSAEFEPGVRVDGIAVFAHLGETALMLLWEGGFAPDPGFVQDLAEAQVDCLTADTCPAFEGLLDAATAVP